MALKRTAPRFVYGVQDAFVQLTPLPIIAQRAPTASDRYEVGTQWIDQPNDDIHVLTRFSAGSAIWINTGGGTGVFNALNVVTTATIGSLGLGVVLSSAAGLLSSTNGTNGQVLLAGTGIVPAWASITAGAGIALTPGANSLTITATGATAVQYTEDDANIVLPDGVGNINVNGAVGGNIVTTGAIANTITINTVANPTFAGLVTCQAGITQSAGTATIASDTNAAQAIYLHANGGINETVEIYVDQSTQAQSLYLHSDLGGVSLASGLAGATAINLNASNAAGGLTFTSGTNGMTFTSTNGAIALTSGTAAINIGVDATVHTITLGSTAGAAATIIQSGTGNLVETSTGTLTLDSAGVLELNSSAGIISIGNDAVAQAINIGTGAAARTITIGNATGATSLVLNNGTGAANIASNATVHTTTIGSITGASSLVTQSGTGAYTVTAGGIFDLNGTGAVTIDSTGGAINIGSDADAQAINIGVGAAARTITIGNGTGATSLVFDSGTGAVNIATNATEHTTTIGSTNAASSLVAQSGTGAFTLTAGGILDVNSTGAVTIDSTGGALSIGAGADAQAINIGTGGAARTITIGNATGATAVDITTGTAGLTITSGGLINVNPATDTQASPSATSVLDVNVGVVTFTGFTTAAGATQAFTITNALASATSGIDCSIANLGGNDAQMQITRTTPAAGSFVVATKNVGTQALNGNVIISFHVLN